MKWYFGIIVGIAFVVVTNLTLLAQNTITWRKTYLVEEAEIRYILPTQWGYMMCGLYRFGGPKLFLMGVNDYGDSLWFKFYNENSGIKTFDLNNGKYMVITSRGDFIQVNDNGDTITTNLNERNIECANAYYIGNRYYLCGRNESLNYNPVLLSCDSLGNEIFYEEYSFHGIARDFVQKDSVLFLVGESNYPSIFLLKTDLSGGFIFLQEYNLDIGVASSILEFSDKIIVGGIGKPLFANGTSATLSKFSLSGTLEWHKTYDPGLPFHGGIFFAKNAFAGNIITFGFGNRVGNPNANEQRLISFDYDGNEMWRKQYGFETEHLDAHGFTQTVDSGYIFSGGTLVSEGNDINGVSVPHVIKSDKFGNVAHTSIQLNASNFPEEIELDQNFPNPFNSSTIIRFEINKTTEFTLSLYEVSGKFIETISNGILNSGRYSINYSPKKKLSSGVYYFVFETKKTILSRKLIYLK